MAGEQMLQCFRESSSTILKLSEIQQWWRERGSGEKQLQELLQQLVENGTMGCRVLTVGGSHYTVYWLKEQQAADLSSTPPSNTPSTPSQPQKGATPMSSSLRERLKRSRPRFVSPLLSSAKKPRLTVAAAARRPVGKLDFADCDQSLSDVTDKLEGQKRKKITSTDSQEDSSNFDCTERTSSTTAEDFRVGIGEGRVGVCSGEGSGVCSSEGSGVCNSEGSSGVCSGEGSGVCSGEGSGVCSGEGSSGVCSGEGSGVCSGEGSGVCSGEGSGGVCRSELLVAEKASLEGQLREVEERLRKLRMVKMYRTKNDLRQLDALIQKWREAAQEAAETLLANSTLQPRPSMAQLLDYLHIDHTIIRYSTEDEAFY